MKEDHPVLVTGATGFVGEHLVRYLVAEGRAVVGVGWARSVRVPGTRMVTVDLREAAGVGGLIASVRPAAVVHCAAMTDVAACQRQPKAAGAQIVDVTRYLADAMSRVQPDTPVVALSTDLVFDGEHAPYREQDPARPLSVYGHLKLAAEGPILGLARGVVVRTSLVYGPPTTHRGSFLAWMIGSLGRGERVGLFEDEVRTPIYVRDLCAAVGALAAGGNRPGLWHLGGPQRLSRYEMGQQVCDLYGFDKGLLEVRRLSASDYPAPRPRDVSLDSTRLSRALNLAARSFSEGLAAVKQQTA